MHVITSNIPTGLLDQVKKGLLAFGVARMRAAEVHGYVEGREAEYVWRGCRIPTPLVPECELQALVCDESVDAAVDLIIKTVRQEVGGDGFVCVTPVEQCYRIRTGHPER
jgi:nitrogen regulatory protein PII